MCWCFRVVLDQSAAVSTLWVCWCLLESAGLIISVCWRALYQRVSVYLAFVGKCWINHIDCSVESGLLLLKSIGLICFSLLNSSCWIHFGVYFDEDICC